jgi:peptide deformylase
MKTRLPRIAFAHVAIFALAAHVAACAHTVDTPAPTPATSQVPSSPEDTAPAPKDSAMLAPKLPPIVQTGAPVLRARAADYPVEKIGSSEFQSLVKTMTAVMRKAPGVGLAAPQIGISTRIIVLEDRDELIANPELSPIGEERATFFEGCLSVNGFVGLVERAREVEVRGYDETGKASVWRVRGWPARILQHEVDHLEGTLYVDRMKTRSFATGDQARALYGGKPIAEILKALGL